MSIGSTMSKWVFLNSGREKYEVTYMLLKAGFDMLRLGMYFLLLQLVFVFLLRSWKSEFVEKNCKMLQKPIILLQLSVKLSLLEILIRISQKKI